MKKQLLAAILCVMLVLAVGCTKPAAEPAVEAPAEETTVEAPAADVESDATETPVEKEVVRVAALKGPTGMGMSYLMEEDSLETTAVDYEFEIVGAPDQLVGQIAKGEVDIAAVPTNLAAVLDVKTEGKIQLLGINTLGVLYVVENGDTVHSITDLKDKIVGATGKGATPEYVLNYLLAENDLVLDENVQVDYMMEHAELASMVAAGDVKIALLPQPYVTTVMMGNPDVRIAIDLNEAWVDSSEALRSLPMGAVVVNKAYAQAHPEVIEAFMSEYKISVDYVNNNPEEAGALIEKYGIIPKAAIATKAIPNCSMTLIPAQEAKSDILAFYEVLKSFNPQAIGGQIPTDDFFYQE
ncbi:MAG: ABC transporter substrate-binding protein [Clostridia bacterium]|nr:ABC transporter substrate-binding protein [Clostridia bacterium]